MNAESEPTRLEVPLPQLNEEYRQLAEALADLHYVLALIIKNAGKLIPGEAVDELKKAWETSRPSMAQLVNSLLAAVPGVPPMGAPPPPKLENELSGDVGKLKRSMLARLKDRFLMFWNSQPETDEKRSKAADAACDYLEAGSTVVSSIPGYEKVVEVLSLVKQLITIRAKRGF